jgi:hypothetical protein
MSKVYRHHLRHGLYSETGEGYNVRSLHQTISEKQSNQNKWIKYLTYQEIIFFQMYFRRGCGKMPQFHLVARKANAGTTFGRENANAATTNNEILQENRLKIDEKGSNFQIKYFWTRVSLAAFATSHMYSCGICVRATKWSCGIFSPPRTI